MQKIYDKMKKAVWLFANVADAMDGFNWFYGKFSDAKKIKNLIHYSAIFYGETYGINLNTLNSRKMNGTADYFVIGLSDLYYPNNTINYYAFKYVCDVNKDDLLFGLGWNSSPFHSPRFNILYKDLKENYDKYVDNAIIHNIIV